jgi:hypothetical protein
MSLLLARLRTRLCTTRMGTRFGSDVRMRARMLVPLHASLHLPAARLVVVASPSRQSLISTHGSVEVDLVTSDAAAPALRARPSFIPAARAVGRRIGVGLSRSSLSSSSKREAARVVLAATPTIQVPIPLRHLSRYLLVSALAPDREVTIPVTHPLNRQSSQDHVAHARALTRQDVTRKPPPSRSLSQEHIVRALALIQEDGTPPAPRHNPPSLRSRIGSALDPIRQNVACMCQPSPSSWQIALAPVLALVLVRVTACAYHPQPR